MGTISSSKALYSYYNTLVNYTFTQVNISGSPSRIRTYNPAVNSRMLYRWAIED